VDDTATLRGLLQRLDERCAAAGCAAPVGPFRSLLGFENNVAIDQPQPLESLADAQAKKHPPQRAMPLT